MVAFRICTANFRPRRDTESGRNLSVQADDQIRAKPSDCASFPRCYAKFRSLLPTIGFRHALHPLIW